MKLPKTNLRLASDVATVIGETYIKNGQPFLETKLSKLCKSNNINIWAKYKPVFGKFDGARPNDWWRAGGDCGIGRKYYSSLDEMYKSLSLGEDQFWHIKPDREYRLGDFAGYDTESTPPFRDWNVDTNIYNDAPRDVTFSIYEKTVISDDDLSLSDVLGGSGFYDWVHMGIAVKKSDDNRIYWMTGTERDSITIDPYDYRNNVFTEGVKEIFFFLTPMSKSGFFQPETGANWFHPIPDGYIHSIRVIDPSVAGSFKFICRPEWSAGIFAYTVGVTNYTGNRIETTLTVQISANEKTDPNHFKLLRTDILGRVVVEIGESTNFSYTKDAIINHELYLDIRLTLYGDDTRLEEIYIQRQGEPSTITLRNLPNLDSFPIERERVLKIK